jgi:DNA-binding response OmpR family regulator
MRILLAEDDLTIADHVRKTLGEAGYQVDHSASGPDVWEIAETSDYAAIVLDLGLPGMDGLSILKRWRNAGLETPVLVLTARGSWMERVDGFEAGADDYLPKPFRTEELLARLKALLRRTRSSLPAIRSAGRFTLNEATRRVTFDGKDIDLSPHEYRLVAYLIDRKGQVVAPLDLANHVQGRDDDTAKNAVEAMVGRLRRKTDMAAIETRRGFGYVITDQAQC